MNWFIVILPVLLILIAWLLWDRIKRNKKKKDVPEDVLAQFQEAERRLEENNGLDPQQILWDIRNGRTARRSVTVREQPVEVRQLPQQPLGREELSRAVTSGLREADEDIRENRPSPRETFLRRIRRNRG